jgi:hypothetical protein
MKKRGYIGENICAIIDLITPKRSIYSIIDWLFRSATQKEFVWKHPGRKVLS